MGRRHSLHPWRERVPKSRRSFRSREELEEIKTHSNIHWHWLRSPWQHNETHQYTTRVFHRSGTERKHRAAQGRVGAGLQPHHDIWLQTTVFDSVHTDWSPWRPETSTENLRMIRVYMAEANPTRTLGRCSIEFNLNTEICERKRERRETSFAKHLWKWRFIWKPSITNSIVKIYFWSYFSGKHLRNIFCIYISIYIHIFLYIYLSLKYTGLHTVQVRRLQTRNLESADGISLQQRTKCVRNITI